MSSRYNHKVAEKKWQKEFSEFTNWLHSQAITIVTTIINGRGILFFNQLFDLRSKIFIVHKKNIISRAKHSLQKTIATVIQAIQHMRKIITATFFKSIALWRRENKISILLGKNQRWRFFLKPKILCVSVKYFSIAIATYPR